MIPLFFVGFTRGQAWHVHMHVGSRRATVSLVTFRTVRSADVAAGGGASPFRVEANPVWGTSPLRETPARAYARDLADLALKVGLQAEKPSNEPPPARQPEPTRATAGSNALSEEHEALIARLLKKHS